MSPVQHTNSFLAPIFPLNEDELAYCSADERRSLALYLLGQGELSLLKEDLSGLDLFEKAAELDPRNPEIFYRQGLALFEYGSEDGKTKALLLAGKKFKAATNLDSNYFDAWQAWGNSLALLGTSNSLHHYFIEAEEKLKKAISVSENKPSEILADLFWDYGMVWSHLADHSGEAVDLQLALDSFQKTCQHQDGLPPEFWNSFGDVCLRMAQQINDIRLNVKAINCFKHSVSLSISSFEGWIFLAKALQMLYTQTHDEDHFSQANECFAAAAHLKPQDTDLWLNWASFLCDSGRRNKDVKRLRAAVEKCQRSYACKSDQPLLMATWAEALALIGELTERLDFIYEAQNKISEAVDLSEEDDPEIWHSYGMCLNSFGRYFGDIDYYFQAIEKFQFALSTDRTSYKNWYAIAKTYAIISDAESDIDSCEKSVRFFSKAIDLRPSTFYILDYALALSKLGDMKQDEKCLTSSVAEFERVLSIQKNAIYLHPDWLFHYASALDMLGDFHEDEAYYLRSIEIFSHVLMIDPDFPEIHHRLALAFFHLGELMSELDHFFRSVHHFRMASKQEEENDQIILDWGVTLISLAHHVHDTQEAEQLYRDAEHKLTHAAKLGNQQAFYHLGCLNSILGQYERAMAFMEKSHASKALPPLEEIMEDEWLDGLRATSFFQEFISHIEKH